MQRFHLLGTSISEELLVHAQKEKLELAWYDGSVLSGNVNQGGFLNFTGPTINATIKKSTFILGMLPSLRFKQDGMAPKNALMSPSLGMWITYICKIWALQAPFYYNAKTG